MTEPRTHSFAAPGAVIHYDVREGGDGTEPTLLLIGSPMAAGGFPTLAGHFADRRVVTYDPRGSERSRRTDDADRTRVEEHVDDLRRLIEAIGGGPVDVFGTSGGAVNTLALVAAHPELVRVAVPHEPPNASALPDKDAAIAACEDVHQAYLRSGFGLGMAKFIALVSHEGPIPEDYTDRPDPDPAAWGLPTEDDGSRDDPLLGQNIPSCNAFELDFRALRAAPTRIVPAYGEESGDIFAARGAHSVAERIGTDAVEFPGGHTGFMGGEYGQEGRPDEFAAKLREVLGS